MRWIRPARTAAARDSTSSRVDAHAGSVSRAATFGTRRRTVKTVQRARPALDVDVAAHRERQLLHDREPEAGADLPLPPVALVQVEALEGVLGVGLVEARARVLDAEEAGLSDDPHLSARRSQAQRVLDEVGDDLEHAVGVRDRRRRSRRSPRGASTPKLSRLLLVAADRVLGHLGEVDLGVVHAEVGAVHPREVEQVAGRAARAAAPRRRRSPPPPAGRRRRPRPPRRSRGSR